LTDSPYSSWNDAIVYRADKQFGSWVRAFIPGAYAWVEWRGDIDMDGASPENSASEIAIPTLLVHSSIDTITPLARPQEYKNLVLDHFRKFGIKLCE